MSNTKRPMGWMVGILLVLALLLGACATPAAAPAAEPAAAEPAAAEPSAEAVKVALLLPGPVTDGGWSQLAYAGLQALAEDPGFATAYAENVSQANIPSVTRGYADDGYDLIIGHGFEFGSAFVEIAPEYPDINFFATTFQPQPEIPANVQYVDAAYFPAAYAAGALAALMSESKVVGFVGGGDNPTQQGMMALFVAGAGQTVEGTTGLGVVTGDYNDAAKGREASATMIGNGADVIWHAADVTGLGAIEGAVAEDAKVLGAYSDQLSLAPDNMGASLVMDLGQMVQTKATEVRDGTFAGGTEWRPSVAEMWHWAAGDGKEFNEAVISAETWAQFAPIWTDLAEGKIDVSSFLE